MLLTIPDSLQLKILPENLAYTTKDFELKVTYTLVGQQLKCLTQLIVFEGKVSPENFDTWNAALTALRLKAYMKPLVLITE